MQSACTTLKRLVLAAAVTAAMACPQTVLEQRRLADQGRRPSHRHRFGPFHGRQNTASTDRRPATGTELNIAFVTLRHGDHCNVPTIRALAAGSRATVALPRPCLKQVRELNIPIERIIVPEPLEPFEIKGIPAEPLHANHGNQEFTVLTR